MAEIEDAYALSVKNAALEQGVSNRLRAAARRVAVPADNPGWRICEGDPNPPLAIACWCHSTASQTSLSLRGGTASWLWSAPLLEWSRKIGRVRAKPFEAADVSQFKAAET